MTHIDPRLLAVARIVRPQFSAPAIFVLGEQVQPARARELEALGAVPTYLAKTVPQIHADFPVREIEALTKSGLPALAFYDEPVFAFQETASNPFRSTKTEIEARIANRLDKSTPGPRPNPHYRTYLGAQGPIMVPMGAKEFTLEDVRRFTRSKDIYDQGNTGRGTKVAVLDTGADPSHPMLEGKIAKAASFVAEEPNTDGNGHSTWCCSAVAGNPIEYQGRIKELRGKRMQGMSEAQLLVGKVLTSEGSGAVSNIIRGVEWAVQEGADVLSMSLGSLFDGAGLTPDAQAVDEATRRGVRVVVAAGNQFGHGTVGSPATARGAIAVGACAMENPVPGAAATFSSKGPTRTGSVRPTLVAPGGQMGPRIDETILGATSGVIAAEVGENFALLRGSSMATPIVAGIIAQMGQAFPKNRERVEEVLAMGTRATVPRPFGGAVGAIKDSRTGWGMIDAVRLREALSREAPPGVRAAALTQSARSRPFLALLAGVLHQWRGQATSHSNTLRLTLT